jgi:hypothetical protein
MHPKTSRKAVQRREPSGVSVYTLGLRSPYPVSVSGTISRGMNLELNDEETAALEREIRRIIDDDKFPLSPRVVTLKAILTKIRPEPERQPLPPPKHYVPPKAVMRKRRRG